VRSRAVELHAHRLPDVEPHIAGLVVDDSGAVAQVGVDQGAFTEAFDDDYAGFGAVAGDDVLRADAECDLARWQAADGHRRDNLGPVWQADNGTALALYDANRRWRVEPGRFTLLVGASSVDIRQTGSFSVEAPDGSVPAEAPVAPVIVP